MNRLFALTVAAGLLVGAAPAQDEFVPDPGQEAAKDKPKEEDPEKEIKDKIKKYDDTLKDTEKFEGPFTFYLKKKEKDVYLELDPSQIGKYWFMMATLRSGANPMGLQAGEPLGREFQTVDAFRWERRDDSMWLYVPNLTFRWAQDDPLGIAAGRTYPEAVLDDFKIEAEHPKTKKMLLKVNQLFHGELFDLNQRISAALGRPYQLDRDKSRVSKVKAFPENVLVQADLYFTSSRGGGGEPDGLLQILGLGGKSHLADDRSLPLSITYLIYPRKESDYMSRLADTRVGYFTQDYFDHARFMRRDRTMRLINRWNLKKKDPKAAVSEPVQPIVWYIDDSVPEKWRDACAEGILRWNKAFEALGYKNALQAKVKPKDADWDHADMRYNVLRFVTSENAGYAIALFRTDPFTGEIVNASISVDANIAMYIGQEYEWVTEPARGTWTASLSKLTRTKELGPKAEPRNSVAESPLGPGWSGAICSIGGGKLDSATFGWTAVEALIPNGTSINRDDYIREFLADVVSHEMGHCLGLRHNFVATTELSLSELGDPAVTGKYGTSASTMDYVPVNIAAVAKGKGHYYSRTIGTYDVFAVEYGYADVSGKTPVEQYSQLMHIASKNSLPGRAFMTDENADMFDPFVARFDFSQNPLDACAKTIEVAKGLLRKADKRYPERGRPYSDLTRAVNISISQTLRQCLLATRFVGGVHGRRNFKGDPNEQPTLAPVDPALQRRAIQLIAREIFGEDSFPLSETMLLNLTVDHNQGRYSDAPIKDTLSAMQIGLLATLMSAETADRVANNAFKLAKRPEKFTVGELCSTLVGKVFSEVGSGREIGVLRRDLQRFAADALITQALAPPGSVPEDVRMIAWDTLKRLSARFGSASASDDMTVMHMRDMKRRIDRALKSIVTAGGGIGQ